MLTEEALSDLQKKHGKIGVVEFEGHQIVFSRPSREQARDFRRKEDSPTEKPDRVDQLAQQTIVALDGETDATKARIGFLSFLQDYPLFCDSPKAQTVLTVLAGGMEATEAKLLGKGCSVRNGIQRNSQSG